MIIKISKTLLKFFNIVKVILIIVANEIKIINLQKTF